MITIRISGPHGESTIKLARRLATTYQVEGKVVRLYDDDTKAPSTIPPCDIAILVQRQENPNG